LVSSGCYGLCARREAESSGIFPAGSRVIFVSVNQVVIEGMLLCPLTGWSSKAGLAGIGLLRAKMKVGMLNLTYNMSRFAYLHAAAARVP
jgi:hypothetical protein